MEAAASPDIEQADGSSTEAEHARFVLLNTLVSQSITRADVDAPLHGAYELFQHLDGRRQRGFAIEFDRGIEDVDDHKRIVGGAGRNFVRLRDLRFIEDGDTVDIVMLIEHVDASVREFAVVDTESFVGREISGNPAERGATSCHVVLRATKDGHVDTAKYRCVIQVEHPLTRKLIQWFLSKNLLRHWQANGMDSFPRPDHSKSKSKNFKYHPRIELHSDIGRVLGTAGSGAQALTQMEFTKKSELQSIGQPTSEIEESVIADVQLRVSVTQAPKGEEEKQTWIQKVLASYARRGYKTKLYYKNSGGVVLFGNVHAQLDSATDLLLCPRETIYLSELPKKWQASIDDEIASHMLALMDRDELWERQKR